MCSEMQKPNTKLCALLEPKKFDTNPIVDFCDSCLGGLEKWIHNATFLMAKFDKQLNSSRTGSKANNFFKVFHKNKCFPHLVITQTLAKEDLPPQKLYEARQKLLTTADIDERTQFRGWMISFAQIPKTAATNYSMLRSRAESDRVCQKGDVRDNACRYCRTHPGSSCSVEGGT
jgi:hypothetical protein